MGAHGATNLYVATDRSGLRVVDEIANDFQRRKVLGRPRRITKFNVPAESIGLVGLIAHEVDLSGAKVQHPRRVLDAAVSASVHL